MESHAVVGEPLHVFSRSFDLCRKPLKSVSKFENSIVRYDIPEMGTVDCAFEPLHNDLIERVRLFFECRMFSVYHDVMPYRRGRLCPILRCQSTRCANLGEIPFLPGTHPLFPSRQPKL